MANRKISSKIPSPETLACKPSEWRNPPKSLEFVNCGLESTKKKKKTLYNITLIYYHFRLKFLFLVSPSLDAELERFKPEDQGELNSEYVLGMLSFEDPQPSATE